MAEEVITTPVTGNAPIGAVPVATVPEGSPLPARPRISWGAIFGGAVSALGLWLLLYALGLALGLSTIDPNNPGSVKGSGIFTGIWSAVSPLIALFVGGLVAGRLSGVLTRGAGALHGLVMWGLVAVGGAYFVGSIVSTTVGGAASAGKAVVEGGGQAIAGVAGGAAGAANRLGLDWNDALAPINQRLRAEGKPTVSADELQAATKDAVQTSVQQGSFDRATFTDAIVDNTSLSQQDADQLAQRAEQQFDRAKSHAKQRAQGVLQSAQTGALKAADVTGKAFWGVFGALLLGLAAAIVGGLVGVPRVPTFERDLRRRRVSRVEPTLRGPTGPSGPILPATPREAYPRP